jgi:hypothetical protein
MAAPGSGEPRPTEVEVLDDGRGRGWSAGGSSRVLSARSRRVLGGIGVAAVVVAAFVSVHRPTATVTASPASGTYDVRLLTDQYSYSTDRSSLSLMLSVVNYGPTAVDVLAARLPQAGARPVPGPGGDLPFGSPVTLAPNDPTELDVLARVSCPSVLTAPLADHIDVTLGQGGQPFRVVSLSLTGLGSVLDDARHQACGATSASAAIYPTMVPGTVRVSTVAAKGRRVVESDLRIENVGGVATSVLINGADPVGVTVSRADGVEDAIDIAKGGTVTVTLRWEVGVCAALEAVRWPTLMLTIRVPTSTATDTYGFDEEFGAAWRQALSKVCAGAAG